ncbi:hypothetical protein [Ralstonia sp. SET104]|uniref:hypothetical protein n=1 Tax=Ralstonia sp. SET104 TaxID=2448774 RepID=UPI000F57C33B|nr:hypothetical protein [Ralstonia sp. SET104]GCB05833.1 hypothetical protein PSUB009319_34640 [Ralstonia sp. SET104]
MTRPIPESIDPKRLEAHAELFDKLSKLRTLLGMLHSNGFEHFKSMEEMRQADYLWTCIGYADGAYNAMLASDGLTNPS